ncbi:hypothetical protein HOV23_gp102 [Pseudomonas phage Lana]|uniref:Uncharacterized protein n=1 Tax=Pseudomonas phage Lana TaxID=2530172 RepID=A0A481W5V5_9CAUD|nr:hypothetical protein HOV23_gp102 [Pseudomonas phage Lana]QBJ04471.1 hypothetical protein [Pseudomonas phage Lana]
MNYFQSGSDKVTAFTLLGIEGQLAQVPGDNGLWVKQSFFARREFKPGGRFDIEISYDRGHHSNTGNSFGMRRDFDGVSGPLMEPEVSKHWPELAHLVKWHLCSDGVPMYYIENTLYWVKAGKLDVARRHCMWPDAPEDLLKGEACYLEVALRERLPQLQQQFRDDLAASGLKLHP